MQESDHLTVPGFWDGAWGDVALPSRLDLHQFSDRSFDELFRKLLPKGRLRLLEVGCAPGRFLLYFSEQMGYAVTGIDYSPVGHQLTRRNLESAGIAGDVIMGDFFSEPIPGESFDLVFSAGFIEHFRDPVPVVQRMRDLVRPGGQVLATVPNVAGFPGLHWKATNREAYDRHNPLSVARLQSLFEQSGLVDIRTGCFGSFRLASPRSEKRSIPERILWYTTRAIDKALRETYDLLKTAPEGPWLSSRLYAIGKRALN